MKRFIDILGSLVLIIILFIPMIFIGALVAYSSKGGALYWSVRVGRHNTYFMMPKFRTLLYDTPTVATHLLSNPKSYYTPIGSILRSSSLDELPQLWSILKGDMSFVGPRPALFNQTKLIALRKNTRIDELRPGLTGLAQISGRDELSDEVKVQFDEQYLKNISFNLDLKIIALTFIQVLFGKNVSH